MDELSQLIDALSKNTAGQVWQSPNTPSFPPNPSWPPTQDTVKNGKVVKSDLNQSIESDNTYGNPVAPYTTIDKQGKGIASVPVATETEVSKWGRIPNTASRNLPTTPAVANWIHNQWLAAQRSPLAQLGFKPGSNIMVPSDETTGGGLNYPTQGPAPVGGAFNPQNNMSVTSESSPRYAVHEGMHRAYQDLRKAGMLPPNLPDEEGMVRANMMRHYGIQGGTIPKIKPSTLDLLEALAAQRIAQKHPGGPR